MRIATGNRTAVFFAAIVVASMVAVPAMAGASTPSNDAPPRTQAPADGLVDQPGQSNGNGQSGGGPPGQSGGQSDGPPGQGDGPPGQSNGPPGHERGADAPDVPVSDVSANSSLHAIVDAAEELEQLDVLPNESRADALNDTASALDATVQEYRRLEHVEDRAAFDHARDAHRSLADLAAASDEAERAVAENVSAGLYAATERSAELAVRDAGAVVADREGEFDSPGQRQKVESALGNALDALERADDRLGDDPSIEDRAKATTHLRQAWKHADRTLDAVEDDVEPELSLTQQSAYEENGSVVVPVTATLSDVRPYAYDELDVTVTAGDADVQATELVAPETPGTEAAATLLVDLGEEPANATIAASATAAHDAERTAEATVAVSVEESDVGWDRPAPDEHGEVAVTDDETGVGVEVAGDGVWRGGVSVTNATPAGEQPYRAAPMVRIDSDTDFDQATVEIPVDADALDGDANLSIVTWDPTTEDGWTTVETDVDRERGVATAEVEHFSYFSVFRIEEWEDHTSDTIALEDRHVVGNLSENTTDGGDALKADFAFVIDTSGSMSGNRRIHFARLAAQRFVGALFEDERAGLVTFASGSSLRHGLTSDHDSLNGTIASLGTGGNTNTGSGLQTAVSELRSEGWENRSSIVILLADGGTNRGPNPVSVAEEASEHDIEISTVGVGSGIDENELRAIAGAADGDFYHVDSAEELPDTFERVAEETGGPELVDSDGDGLPDAAEEADLRAPDGGPNVVGEPLDLDPHSVDSDGDGILDNESVDVEYRIVEQDNETRLYASVTSVLVRPNVADSTGDGLTDREQLRGWEIEVVDDPNAAQSMMAALEDPDVDADPADYFETKEVESHPLLTDTDNDGLSDAEERDLGTDPESSDTTGDGIADREAFDDVDEDPTVFSTSAPEGELLDFYEWTEAPDVDVDVGWGGVDVDADGPSWNFRYRVRIEDDSGGISEYSIERGRYTVGGETLPDEPRTHIADHTLSSLREGVFTSWRGGQATLEATDGYGNEGAERIHSQTSFYGDVIGRHVDPYAGGVLSGFTHSAAELPELIATIGEALWDDPQGAAGDFVDMVSGIDSDALSQILPAMIESTREQQRLDNPHSEGSDEYEEYAEGWYHGYALHFLASMVYGGTITKGVTEGANVGARLSRVADDLPVRSPALRADGSGLKSARIANRLADEGYDGLAAQFRTAGKEAQVVKALADVDSRILRQLDETQRTELLEYLGKYPDGARLVDDLGPQQADDLLSLSVRNVDGTQLRENLFRLHSQGVPSDDINRFVQNLDELEGTTGLHRSIEDTVNGGTPSNFRGDLFETEVAVQKGADNVEEMGKSIPGGEVDIVMENRLVETKSGSYSGVAAGDDQYQELASQLATYERYADDSDVIEVAFRSEPSGDVKSLLDRKGIEYTH